MWICSELCTYCTELVDCKLEATVVLCLQSESHIYGTIVSAFADEPRDVVLRVGNALTAQHKQVNCSELFNRSYTLK